MAQGLEAADAGAPGPGEEQRAARIVPGSADPAQPAGNVPPGNCSTGDRQQDDSAEPETAVVEVEEVGKSAEQEEEERAMVAAAEVLKQEGNRLYGEGKYAAAADKYNEAIHTAPEEHTGCAVYYANLAACLLRMEGRTADAAQACSAAVALDPTYSKALMRRCTALEQLDDLDNALVDAKKVLELDASSSWAKSTIQRLEPLVAERHEKLKNEMFGKLKELGNSILGRFGMSVDNFKAEKDPNSGSYSIRFEQ